MKQILYLFLILLLQLSLINFLSIKNLVKSKDKIENTEKITVKNTVKENNIKNPLLKIEDMEQPHKFNETPKIRTTFEKPVIEHSQVYKTIASNKNVVETPQHNNGGLKDAIIISNHSTNVVNPGAMDEDVNYMTDVIRGHPTSVKPPPGQVNNLYENAKKDLQDIRRQQFNQQGHLYKDSQFIHFEANKTNDPFSNQNNNVGAFLSNPPPTLNQQMAYNGRTINNQGFMPLLYNPVLNNPIIPNINPNTIVGANSNNPSMMMYNNMPAMSFGNPVNNFNNMNMMNGLNINNQVSLVPDNINILKPLSIPMDPNTKLNNDITNQFLQSKIQNHNMNQKFNMALHFKNEKHHNASPIMDLNTLDMQVKHIGTLTRPQLTKLYGDLKYQENHLEKEDELLAKKNKDYYQQINVILDSQKKEINSMEEDLKKLTVKVDDKERQLINREIEDEFGKAMEGYSTFKAKHPHLNKIDPKDYMDISNMIHMELANKNFYLKIDDY